MNGPGSLAAARFEFLLRLGDTSLVLGQRLGEWIGHAPAFEEDLALANIALDLIGQARWLLTHAGEIEGRGRGEDDLAYLRDSLDFRNLSLAEQPNGDFAQTIVRQVFIDRYQLETYRSLRTSTDERLRDIAARALKETEYHYRFSSNWLLRLGDGTDESHRRAQAAVDALWPFTSEGFIDDEIDREIAAAGIAPLASTLRGAWQADIERLIADATLTRPPSVRFVVAGRRGRHTEHLGRLLAEMQHLQRAYPGATW